MWAGGGFAGDRLAALGALNKGHYCVLRLCSKYVEAMLKLSSQKSLFWAKVKQKTAPQILRNFADMRRSGCDFGAKLALANMPLALLPQGRRSVLEESSKSLATLLQHTCKYVRARVRVFFSLSYIYILILKGKGSGERDG